VTSQPCPYYRNIDVSGLEAISDHWGIKPLWAVVTCNDDILPENTCPEEEIAYVEISSVKAGQGITEVAELPFGDAPSRARRKVENGDVLISTVRTYLRAITPVLDPPNNLVVSTGFAVLRPRAIDSGFLGYAVQTEFFIAEVISRSVGVSYPAINASDLVRIKVPLPPLPEQSVIAAFLDRETGKIDTLVKEQKRLIELLKEKRQAVISQAVTKGINPDTKMKDSGIEWLGEVPEHWEMKRLKYLVASKSGPFGSALTKDQYVESGYRVYGQEQVIPGDFSIGDYYISAERFAELAQYRVMGGDILVSCVGTFGKIAIVPDKVESGIINPRLIRLRIITPIIPKYLETLLKSHFVYEQFSLLSRGGTMDVINIETLNSITIVVPPIDEQSRILAWLDRETANIDTFIEQSELAITLLQERRASLISAAVTGKIDVRNAGQAEQEVA